MLREGQDRLNFCFRSKNKTNGIVGIRNPEWSLCVYQGFLTGV
jgi:hypothetical protein